MNTQNEPNPQQPVLSVTAILSIISVVLAAGWIAFAYYKGSANSSRILLLHPVVPILLMVLLIRVYRWIDLKSIVILEILMIAVWIFIRLLGVLTPFILGFGFAYIFRFLWNALPFKAQYQRGIATVLIVFVCGALLFYTGKQVSKQATQMGSGLLKFYHEIVLPYIVGETFEAVAISVNEGNVAEADEQATPAETFYLGTNHGVYEIRQGAEPELDRIGITNSGLLGKPIQALAAVGNVIYAGTRSGLYRYYKALPIDATKAIEDNVTRIRNPRIWHKVQGTPFDTLSVQAISVPNWDNTQIYVGTQKGLYSSKDLGQTWREVAPNIYSDRSIISIVSIVDTNGDRIIYVASTAIIDAMSVGASSSSLSPSITPQATMVHWYLEDSSLEWNPLPSATHPVYALASGGRTWNVRQASVGLRLEDPSPEVDIELYAGTPDGLYEWHRLGTWRKTEGTAAVSLIASAPSGVYIGNGISILHRALPAAGWQPFATRNEGISYTYRDEPIVQQVKTYLTERIPTIAQTGGEAVKEGVQLAGSIAFGFGGFLATVSLAFIVFVYANQSFDKYFRSFIMLVPELHRETAKTYLREIDRNLQQFLKGLVAVIAIVSVVSCIAYSIIGVPFALVIGVIAGICNAIPTFGPFIGGGFAYVAMLMGLAAGDFGIIDFLIRSAFLLAAILGIQTLDNSLISPKIMSTAVDVDPLLIMFAVIVGAAVLGFWGVLLAIPIIVVVKSVIAVSQSVATDGRLEVNSANDATENP
ncbi:AI-2E family transporter [Candidatus Poribacteria bacterium]|nr:AI-2E family transporter [Candidatus Poribacteria bacterium]